MYILLHKFQQSTLTHPQLFQVRKQVIIYIMNINYCTNPKIDFHTNKHNLFVMHICRNTCTFFCRSFNKQHSHIPNCFKY